MTRRSRLSKSTVQLRRRHVSDMGSKVTQHSSCLLTVSNCCVSVPVRPAVCGAAGIVVEKYSGSRTYEDLMQFVDDNRLDD